MTRDGAASVRQAFPSSAARDEATLVSRIARRDPRGFEALYRLYKPRLSRFILNMVHRPPLVEEILNDTMMVIWRKAETYDGQSKVSTWIFAIAYRRALNALRGLKSRSRTRTRNDARAPKRGPERQFGRRQTHDLLLSAMDATVGGPPRRRGSDLFPRDGLPRDRPHHGVPRGHSKNANVPRSATSETRACRTS